MASATKIQQFSFNCAANYLLIFSEWKTCTAINSSNQAGGTKTSLLCTSFMKHVLWIEYRAAIVERLHSTSCYGGMRTYTSIMCAYIFPRYLRKLCQRTQSYSCVESPKAITVVFEGEQEYVVCIPNTVIIILNHHYRRRRCRCHRYKWNVFDFPPLCCSHPLHLLALPCVSAYRDCTFAPPSITLACLRLS